jgi:hypothetical protein
MLDKIGFEIPAHLEDAWTEADKIGRELCNQVQRIYLMIEKGKAADDLIYREIGQSCVEDLKTHGALCKGWRTWRRSQRPKKRKPSHRLKPKGLDHETNNQAANVARDRLLALWRKIVRGVRLYPDQVCFM